MTRQIKPQDAPLIPSKELYESYIHPMITKNGVTRKKTPREMSFTQIVYHNWMMNYWVRNIHQLEEDECKVSPYECARHSYGAVIPAPYKCEAVY
jgi:hypothetical protein